MKNNKKTIILAGILVLVGVGLVIVSPNVASAQITSVIGNLTEPDGITPFPNADLTLHNYDWSYMQWDVSSSDGAFSFLDVPSDSYVLEVYSNSSEFIDPPPIDFFYDGSGVYDVGNISLENAGNADVTLTLLMSDTITPVVGYWVDLYKDGSPNWQGGMTNDQGVVTFSLSENGGYYFMLNGSYNGESPSDSKISFNYNGQPVTRTVTFEGANVFGYIKTPNETPCASDCSISFYDRNWQNYYWADPDENGYFGINIPKDGSYYYRVEYWGSGSYTAPGEKLVTIDADANNNLGTIYLLTPNITGRLVDGEGNGVDGAWWDFHNSNWTYFNSGSTDENGNFGIGVENNGTYYLDFWIDSSRFELAAPPTQTVTYTGTAVNLGNIALQAPVLKGKVVDFNGNPVTGASVDFHDQFYSWEGSWWGSTDANGDFIVNKGVNSGTYYINVNPPWDAEGMLPSGNIEVKVTSGQTNQYYYNNPIELAQAKKTITGVVKYADGRKVTDAQIETWAMGGMFSSYSMGQTNSNGRYSLSVGAGQYQVNIWPMWGWNNETPDWGSPGPQTVEFNKANNIEESVTVNFTVAEYNATLRGKVVMPDGSEPGDMMVDINAWSTGDFMGNYTTAKSNGSFEMSVLGGKTYNVNIFAWGFGEGETEYAGPSINPTVVGNDETVNLGTLKLVEKNATITGRITDTNGDTLEGIYLDAWSMKSMGWGSAQTESDGTYSMAVFPGDYMVNAFPSWESSESGANYVPIEAPQEIEINANQVVSDVNFQLGIADATIKGHLEDPEGNLINSWGFANASNDSSDYQTGDMWYGGFLGGPLNNGQFEIPVPAGTYNIDVFMDWNSSYIQSAKVTVKVAANETKDDVVVTMLPTDAKIKGVFKDSDGNAVSNLWGEIFADRSKGGSAFSHIEYNGYYEIDVCAGTWNLNYFIDPWSGSAYLPSGLEDKKVIIESGETLTIDFTVLAADSEISGVVQDEDGNALEGVSVYASLDYAGKKRDDAYSYYGFNKLESTSDENGEFLIMVPEGEYYVISSMPPELGYIFTDAQLVYTSPTEPADNIEVVFKTADSQITGEVELDGTGSEAFIYAYTDDGGYVETTTDDGSYTLMVTSGDTWNVGAAEEDGNSYYLTDQEEVEVDDTNGEEQDLTLNYEGEMPDPITKTFDATAAQSIELSDGMSLEIPARALDSEGYVSVSIDPDAELAYTASSQPLSGYGYDIEARDSNGNQITNFNSNVLLELPYDDDIAVDLGLEEDDLNGEYYDTTSGGWEDPNSVIMDADNDTMGVQVDHFTVFSPTAPGVSNQSGVPVGDLTISLTSPEDNAIVSTDSVTVAGTVSGASATVTIRLAGVNIGDVAVDSNGAFSETLTGLADGSNTITVDAVLGILSADTITRTVVYTADGEVPLDTPTGISYDIAVTTNEDSAPHVRIFNSQGTMQNQFFAFSEIYRGEFRIITADVNGDGEMEIIAWPYGEGFGPQVRIFAQDGTLLDQEFVLNEGYRGGIELVNRIDLDGDGQQDFVLSPRGSGGTNLRAYKYSAKNGIELLAWTQPYQSEYTGPVKISTGDVTGDGNVNIIVSPLEGGPNVRIYHYDSTDGALELDDWLMAYQEEYQGGVLVATGDVNGDGTKDVICYPEEDAGANIRAYSYNSNSEKFELIDWIQPYADDYRGSLTVKVSDLDKDGTAEVITAPATGGGPNLRVYSYSSSTGKFALKDWELVLAEDFRGGLGLEVSNLDGDGYREVVVYPLTGGGPNLRVYEYGANEKLTLLDWTLAYAEDFRGEMSVKVGDLEGDGNSELVVSPLSEGGPNVRIYGVADGELTLVDWFMAYADTFRGGVLTNFIN